MGIDYEGVGGVGFRFDESMGIKAGLFTQEDWNHDDDECMGRVGLPYEIAGNLYSGNHWYVLTVGGSTLGEVNANAKEFVAKVEEKLGITLTTSELSVIVDYCVS